MNHRMFLLLTWIQFILLMILTFLVFLCLHGCRCGIITTDDIFFLGCGIGTEPVGQLVAEPNLLQVDYTSKPQRVRAVYPPFGIETQ